MDAITLDAENFENLGYHFDLQDNVYDSNNNLIINFTIPDTITINGKKYRIEYIDNYLFVENETLKEITLPKYLKGINPYTFQYCTALEKVNINPNLEEISAYAFNYCSNLKEFICPESLRFIGFRAFENSGLEKIIFGDNVEIDSGAFIGTNIKEITLPKNLKILKGSMFNNCTLLEKVNFNENLKYIKNSFFGEFPNLKELVLPESLEITDEYFLHGLKSPKTIVYLPNNIDKEIKEILLERKDTTFKVLSLEKLIENGQSFKEINKIFKKSNISL